MAKQLRSKFGNKAKDRRAAHNEKTEKYTRQRVRTEANKRRRRARHLAKHPNDYQAKAAWQV